MKRQIVYFNEPGPQNTDAVLDAVLDRAKEDAFKYLVVATGGPTLLKAVKRIRAAKLPLQAVGVTLQAGTWKTYGEPDWKLLKEAQELGAQVITATHSLMGNVESAIHSKFGGIPPVELIAHTYYTFSQGTKVAVEIALTAVDAGIVPAGTDILSVAGSGQGADTAFVLKAVSTVDFFDLKIREVLCIPH